MKKKCEVCGKSVPDPYATHCSEKCLFSSIKGAHEVVQKYPARYNRPGLSPERA
ncbi:MAG: hypothetical protein KGI33_02070 [Thaumarchaeota archaeon]|nr:hypothetical protein [Nitrososphaerota archaeon]